MRLITTLACALLGAAVASASAVPSIPDTGVSFTYDAPSIHPNSTLEERTGGGHGGGGNKDHCKKGRGRRPDSCECYSGMSCGNKVDKCECGDQKNAFFNFCSTCPNDEPKCVCHGENQKYDHKQHKCVCKPGYEPKYKNGGKLECKPCKPTPSKRPPHHGGHGGKRSLETGVAARSEDVISREAEDAMGCSANEKACMVKGSWSCFNIESNLESCGGCPGEGKDCASIDGVDEVRCAAGQCVIDSCQSGFTLDLAASVCVARGQFWNDLLVQA